MKFLKGLISMIARWFGASPAVANDLGNLAVDLRAQKTAKGVGQTVTLSTPVPDNISAGDAGPPGKNL